MIDNIPEPDHVTTLRRRLLRFVEEKAPRDKRRTWDKEHTWLRVTRTAASVMRRAHDLRITRVWRRASARLL
jgi:hypothetical protein